MIFALALGIFASCEREKEAFISADIKPMTLAAFTPTTLAYELENAADAFPKISWQATDWGFAAAVTYDVQVAVKGTNFAKPTTLATTTAMEVSLKVGDVNKKLLDDEYEPGATVTLELRVKGSVSPNAAPVYSEVREFTITPYATSFPPIYMVGAALGAWDWTKQVEVASNAPNNYTTVAYFIKDGAFRFFKQQDWNPTSWNFPFFDGGSVSPLFVNAADGDSNLKFVGETGYYTIVVNLKTKTITMEPYDVKLTKMFMTGAAVGGWNWTTDYVEMTWKSHQVWEATTDFIKGETFRFFAQADWSPTSYNYPYFTAPNSVTPLFSNAEDGDKNFRMVGETGTYKVTLSLKDNNSYVTMTPITK